jgi:H+/Na+-translocating ferredoxin:NAD+ oxidoreductase subunit D
MTRRFETLTAPYIVPRISVPVTMRRVLYALVPAACVYIWFFGIGLLINFVVAGVTALALEALVLRWRTTVPRTTVGDGSALVTAALLAFSLPPLVPAWIPMLGAAVAILLGKHLYGGLGRNLFNPAMLGYVVLLISFPVEMTQWLPPRIGDLDYAYVGWLDNLRYAFTGTLAPDLTVDALTRATPLDLVKEGLRSMQTFAEARSGALFGDFTGRGWEWIGNMIALGGIYLLYTGTIRWRIPFAVLVGLAVPATILYAIDPSRHAGPGFHLFSGATLLGAFFIATDPVTAATSDRGRLIFGLGIGALTYSIRTWGGYPDGMAFAILLMNAAAPLIDRYTQPRIYGH